MPSSVASVFCVDCEHDHPLDGAGAIVDRCGSPSCPCVLYVRKRGTRAVTVATKLALSAVRRCGQCGEVLQRRNTPGHRERDTEFLKRRFCSRSCGGMARATSDAPLTKEQAPQRDQCWAGFVVGRRCVLDRGSHVTHRDKAGHEFVRVERKPIEYVERNAPVSSLTEHLSMRSEWRSARRS